ncbi:MAG: DNA-binding protein [Ktedonobacteraceae bacterium]
MKPGKMRKQKKASRFWLSLALCFTTSSVFGQLRKITAAEAKNHIGKRATVCGDVASTRYADRSKGQPTFLNLDEPYPRQVFTIVIWESDRSKFGEPEKEYRDKRVCAAGIIKSYRGSPEIVASDPKEIEMQK